MHTLHESTEGWLRFAAMEANEIALLFREGNTHAAAGDLRRVSRILRQFLRIRRVTLREAGLDEEMSHTSSTAIGQLLTANDERLWPAFIAMLDENGDTIPAIYGDPTGHSASFQLCERLVELDYLTRAWRTLADDEQAHRTSGDEWADPSSPRRRVLAKILQYRERLDDSVPIERHQPVRRSTAPHRFPRRASSNDGSR